MSKKKTALISHDSTLIDEITLFERVAAIIENRKYRAFLGLKGRRITAQDKGACAAALHGQGNMSQSFSW